MLQKNYSNPFKMSTVEEIDRKIEQQVGIILKEKESVSMIPMY